MSTLDHAQLRRLSPRWLWTCAWWWRVSIEVRRLPAAQGTVNIGGGPGLHYLY